MSTTSIAKLLALLGSLVLGLVASGCSHAVLGQRIAPHGLRSYWADFYPADKDVAVLHYYGVGGWGIFWQGSYLLTAPYFSNHGYLESSVCEEKPDTKAIEAGFAGTPFEQTSVILVGHGHIDHASDISEYPFDKMREPTLIADESTINLLGYETRDHVCEIPLHTGEGPVAVSSKKCPTPHFRIRALPWAHAPHAVLDPGLHVTVGDPQGTQDVALAQPPTRGNDWRVGPTWAFLIELLDDKGKPVFRIHYVDAAANPSFVSAQPPPSDPTDLHIGCVPGFDYVEGYPTRLIKEYHVKYVMAGHWEDFFRDRECRLAPVLGLDDDKMGQFVTQAQRSIVGPSCEHAPINKAGCVVGKDCGPHGDSWTVPIPGETFWFHTAKKAAAAPD